MKPLNAFLGFLAAGATLTAALPKAFPAFEIAEPDPSVLHGLRSLAAYNGPEPQASCTREHSFPSKLREPFKTVFCNATSNFHGNHYDGITTWYIKYHINEADYGHVDPSFIVVAPLKQPNITFTVEQCMRSFDILMNICVDTREARNYGGTYYDGIFSWIISIMPTEHEKRDLSIGQRIETQPVSSVSPSITSLPLTWGDLNALRSPSLFKCDPPSDHAVRRGDAYKFAFEFCNSTAGVQSESVIEGRQFWWWQTEYNTDGGKFWAYLIAGGPTNEKVKYRIDACHVGVYSLFASCGDAEQPQYYPGTYTDASGFVYFLRLIDRSPDQPVTTTPASEVDAGAASDLIPRDQQALAGIIQCDANDNRTVKVESMIVPVTDFCARTAGAWHFGTASATYAVESLEVQFYSIVRTQNPWVYSLEQCTTKLWQVLHSCQSTHFGQIIVRGGTNDEFVHIWKVDIHEIAEKPLEISPNRPRATGKSLDNRQVSNLVLPRYPKLRPVV